MRKKVFWTIGMVSILLILGCASRTDVKQFKDDMLYVRLRLDGIQSENQKILALMQDLNTTIATLQEDSRRTKADLIAEMTTLRERTTYLQNLLDDTGDRMSRLLHSVQDKTVTTQTPPSSAEFEPTTADSLLFLTDSTSTPIGDNLNAKELYDAAYLDLSKGDYDLALQGFREYLRAFPQSEYSDNAQYWIGEIYYAKGEFERSFNEFDIIGKQFPDGDKVPAALLKMGYCLINLDDDRSARQYLNQVVERFPDSAEAGLARSRLEEM